MPSPTAARALTRFFLGVVKDPGEKYQLPLPDFFWVLR